jgi:hypothetical protein
VAEPINITDARAKQHEEHAAKVRRLFDDHPEFAREAVIIVPSEGLLLVPKHMGATEITGVLERPKHMGATEITGVLERAKFAWLLAHFTGEGGDG